MSRLIASFNGAEVDEGVFLFRLIIEPGGTSLFAAESHVHEMVGAHRYRRLDPVSTKDDIQNTVHYGAPRLAVATLAVRYAGDPVTAGPFSELFARALIGWFEHGPPDRHSSIKATMEDALEQNTPNDERTDTMRDVVVRSFRERYGDEWGRDPEATLRFSLDAEHLLQMVDGAHLIGDAETGDGEVCLRVWVDRPLRDLMSADQLAYDIFARLSEDLFFAERRFEKKSVCYPFVTGTSRGGYIGSLILSGPYAADFADQFQRSLTGGRGYQA